MSLAVIQMVSQDDVLANLAAARRLLQQLQGWLASRGAGVGRCTLELQHEKYAGSTRRGLPPTGVQLDRAERIARPVFGFGERLDPQPWLGFRPCTPDMRPVIGPAPAHRPVCLSSRATRLPWGGRSRR